MVASKTTKKSEIAYVRTRDQDGHFVKEIVPLTHKKIKSNDKLFSFQFHFFNPLHWFMDYLVKLEKNRDGRISVKIPYLWFLTFLVVVMGGSGVAGAALTGPRTYIEGQLAERMVWLAKPTPTPIIVIPTPAPVLVTRLGTVRATYQVKNLLATVSPMPAASMSAEIATPTPITPLRYVLIAENNELIFLTVPANVSLNYYLGSRVLVTGYYDASARSLAIKTTDDVEVVY